VLDAGYTDADLPVTASQEHQMTVIGPVRPNHCWQAVAQTGFAVAAFTLDWTAQRATCPQGNTTRQMVRNP
jgi:transposase